MALCIEAVVLRAPHIIEQLGTVEIGVLLKKIVLCLLQAGSSWLGNHKNGVVAAMLRKNADLLGDKGQPALRRRCRSCCRAAGTKYFHGVVFMRRSSCQRLVWLSKKRSTLEAGLR